MLSNNCCYLFQGNFWVIAVNLAFSFLSVFHLAYLGIMFGGDTEAQEKVQCVLIYYFLLLSISIIFFVCVFHFVGQIKEIIFLSAEDFLAIQ